MGCRAPLLALLCVCFLAACGGEGEEGPREGSPLPRETDAPAAEGEVRARVEDVLRQLREMEDLDDCPSEQVLSQLDALGDEGVLVLARALRSEHEAIWERSEKIAERLGAAAVEALLPALSEDSPDVRWRAAYILGQGGWAPERAIPALTKLLDDPDYDVSF